MSSPPIATDSAPAARLRPVAPSLGLAAAVFAIGLLITVWLWQDAARQFALAEEARFEYRTERIRGELEHRLEGYETALRSVAGLIGARASFDRGQWRRYFDKVSEEEHYPGRLLIGYAPRVAAADREAHEALARQEGLAGYAVREAEPGATTHYPLAYLRRVGQAEGIPMGADLASDPALRPAMARAAAEARSVLAGPLRWSPGPGQEQQTWALLMPVFGGAAVPAGATERQGAVIGYLIEAFNAMETAGSTLGPDAALIGLKVHDGDNALFTCPEMKKELARGFQPTLVRRATLAYGTRTWAMEFVALPGYMAQVQGQTPHIVLAAGTLVSLLLAGLVGTMAVLRQRALRLVDERTVALRSALVRTAASEAQMRAVVDHALDAIITIDERGLIRSFNPAAERIFGYQEAEIRGRNVLVLMPPPDRESHDTYLSRYHGGGTPRIIGIGREVSGLRKDGSTFPLELGVSEMAVDGERLYCGIVRDITERQLAQHALQAERALLEQRVKVRTEVLTQTNHALEQEVAERRRVEAELVSAREQALQAAEAKAGFLANMSHEIRTPMNAVIGMTALLEETPLTAEQRDCVQTIRVSGDALLGVINDILDFSKVESGMLALEKQPFELGALIEEAVDMLAPRAAEKGIDLLYVLADDVPTWIEGDAMRLRQVLVNLLSNAVKFTDRGEVCLTVGVLAPAADDGALRLQFVVRDTGIGVPPAQRVHLFRAFSQGDSSTTRKYGGTGLGLAISQRLVHLMGGVIWLESDDSGEEGRGSRFGFTMPTTPAHPPVTTARYRLDAAPELAGKRVLLVDDNATNLHILETLCHRWGMEVASAADAPQALALLDRDRLFDLAVLDLHMPGMDGVGLARQIRWLCPGTLPALVLLSSGAQRRGPREAAELFAARLAKPVKHSQLFETLQRLVAEGAGQPGPAEPTRRLDPTLAQRLPLRVLVAEDSAINQKLAVGILGKLGYAAEVADNGREALELMRLNPYDLVFMDLQMPEMDGLEATRRIVAEQPAERRPRIVAMTANALAGDRERCLAAGMDDYLAKPILPVDMQAVIERMAPGQTPPPLPAEAATAPLVDHRIVDELRALDDPDMPSLLRTLLRDYLAETPAAISDIKRYTDRRETAQVAQRVHKLAGVSASLGAAGMAEICRRIEQQIEAGEFTALPAMIDQLELRFARTRGELQQVV